MADRPVRTSLLKLLRRDQRLRLANRLLAFALFAAGLYLLLLIAVLAFALPLLHFHLFFYCGLSLLPLFLILGPERERTLAVVRLVDDRCQAEAYIGTTSAEHRAFLEPRVLGLLTRALGGKVLRFRLSAWNRGLALGVASLFVAFQLLSLATLRGVPNLSASSIVTRKAMQEAVARSSEHSGESRAEAQTAAGEAPDTGAAGTAGGKSAGPDETGTGPAAEAGGPFPDTGVPVNPSLGEAPGSGTEGGGWAAIPKSETGIGPALKGALEGSPEPALQQGQVPAGVGEAGKAFLPSPLADYASVEQRIPTERGSRLAASSPAEPRAQPALRTLFGDFPALPALAPGFDPALERLQRRYLELLNERF